VERAASETEFRGVSPLSRCLTTECPDTDRFGWEARRRRPFASRHRRSRPDSSRTSGRPTAQAPPARILSSSEFFRRKLTKNLTVFVCSGGLRRVRPTGRAPACYAGVPSCMCEFESRTLRFLIGLLAWAAERYGDLSVKQVGCPPRAGSTPAPRTRRGRLTVGHPPRKRTRAARPVWVRVPLSPLLLF
jgi:hypothetical protein